MQICHNLLNFLNITHDRFRHIIVKDRSQKNVLLLGKTLHTIDDFADNLARRRQRLETSTLPASILDRSSISLIRYKQALAIALNIGQQFALIHR